jgi:hypothetical protein
MRRPAPTSGCTDPGDQCFEIGGIFEEVSCRPTASRNRPWIPGTPIGVRRKASGAPERLLTPVVIETRRNRTKVARTVVLRVVNTFSCVLGLLWSELRDCRLDLGEAQWFVIIRVQGVPGSGYTREAGIPAAQLYPRPRYTHVPGLPWTRGIPAMRVELAGLDRHLANPVRKSRTIWAPAGHQVGATRNTNLGPPISGGSSKTSF